MVQGLADYATTNFKSVKQLLIHLIQFLKRFFVLKAEVDKLDINKLLNVPTNLNNLKTKVDDLDIAKFQNFPVDLETLSDEDKKNCSKHFLTQ